MDPFAKALKASQKSGKSAAQSTARLIRDESLESLRSVKTQVGLPASEVAQLRSEPPSIVDHIRSTGPSNVDPEEIRKREQMLYRQWQQKLEGIMAEETALRREQEEKKEAWKKSQEEALTATNKPKEAVVMPTGKRKRGLSGAMAAVKQKMTKAEAKLGKN